MSSESSPTNGSSGKDRPRLSEAQKKANHIRSEQKRREGIRQGFDRLASIVPGMEGQGRSEAVVLEATLEFMREKIEERQKLIDAAKASGLDATAWELPPYTIQANERQKKRNEVEQQQQSDQQQSEQHKSDQQQSEPQRSEQHQVEPQGSDQQPSEQQQTNGSAQ